jgi:hypothetical protein
MLHAVSPPRHTHDCQQLTATFRQTSTVNRCVAGSSYGCNVTEQGPLLWLARGCRGTIDCGPHHHRRVTCGDWRAWERTYTCGCGGARADSGATPATAPSRQADQTGGGRARGTGRKNQTQPRHQRHAATGNASEPAPVPADVRHLRFVEENETTVPVQRVVFIRSPTGIGDNLNGLVSGYWLSKALGANFSVCWPEIANTNVTWRIPTVIERECLEPKRRFEWLASELVLHASELAPRHSQYPQHFMRETMSLRLLVERDYAMLHFYAGSPHQVWGQFSSKRWARLRVRPTLYVSTNRGLTSFLHGKCQYTPQTCRSGQLESAVFRGTPFQAFGAALGDILKLKPTSGDVCMHQRVGESPRHVRPPGSDHGAHLRVTPERRRGFGADEALQRPRLRSLEPRFATQMADG